MSQARKVTNEDKVRLKTYQPNEIEGLVAFPDVSMEKQMIQQIFPEKWEIVISCPSEKSARKLADFLRSLGY